ncbi:MAG TPA: GNAT family N-acetyltransferase [Candidatus Limnocylindria bacterium]|nr:GNAT family N-acetyltransferase [Candidatus Limnocylindria bacterium]
MGEDAVIRSERLALPLLSLEQLDRLAAGDAASVAGDLGATLSEAWLREVRWLAALRAEQIRKRPGDAPWLVRPILLRHDDGSVTAVGYLNFHAAPDEHGMIEVGYALLPEAQGQGYAIEAVHAAFEWATRLHGIHRFRASVAPTNERSLNLIAKLGFRHVGEQWDEDDGLELVFELEV